jgi:hypothetical protein
MPTTGPSARDISPANRKRTTRPTIVTRFRIPRTVRRGPSGVCAEHSRSRVPDQLRRAGARSRRASRSHSELRPLSTSQTRTRRATVATSTCGAPGREGEARERIAAKKPECEAGGEGRSRRTARRSRASPPARLAAGRKQQTSATTASAPTAVQRRASSPRVRVTSIDGGRSGRTFRLIETQGRRE